MEYQLPISVKLVVDYQGRVPLLKNERDEWELPGGKLEVGESPEHGVCREVAEELGLTITSVDIIDTWVYEINPVRRAFIVSYGTRYTGDEHPTYSDEHKELDLSTMRRPWPTHARALQDHHRPLEATALTPVADRRADEPNRPPLPRPPRSEARSSTDRGMAIASLWS